MIMSNFMYWKETFQESSIYVNPSNAEDIKNAVYRLVHNKDLMKRMSLLNIKCANEDYNWEKESKKFLKLYENLGVIKC
jgi:glycosyltransferase involved in cell wall biosynthesis